jgi:myo-inositol-1(or 4)-monophosphatase
MDRSELAYSAAKAGADIAYSLFGTDLDVTTKDSKIDYVTTADQKAQERIVDRIHQESPDAQIVGEEQNVSKTIPESGDVWVIDPIDGTTNFVNGIPIWTVSLAAIQDGEPVAAVNLLPALDEEYVASSDGTKRDDEIVSVSETADIESFTASPILRYGFAQRNEFAAVTGDVIKTVGDIRRFGCAQATLALVARGAIDVTFSTVQPNPWDTVAGAYMVEQAGGKVTDIHGEHWTPASQGIVASNGQNHERMVTLVRRSRERALG